MTMLKTLKKNEKPFGMLSEEQREFMRKIDKKYIQWFNGEKWTVGSLNYLCANRIDPDYQPEPENKFVECEIFERCEEELCCKMKVRDCKTVLSLSDIMNHKGFYGFLYEDGTINASPLLYKDVKSNVPPVVHHFPDSIAIRPIKVLFRKGEM